MWRVKSNLSGKWFQEPWLTFCVAPSHLRSPYLRSMSVPQCHLKRKSPSFSWIFIELSRFQRPLKEEGCWGSGVSPRNDRGILEGIGSRWSAFGCGVAFMWSFLTHTRKLNTNIHSDLNRYKFLHNSNNTYRVGANWGGFGVSPLVEWMFLNNNVLNWRCVQYLVNCKLIGLTKGNVNEAWSACTWSTFYARSLISQVPKWQFSISLFVSINHLISREEKIWKKKLVNLIYVW